MTKPHESDGTDAWVPFVPAPNGDAGDSTTRCSGCLERPEIIRALNTMTGNLSIARKLLAEQLELKPLGSVRAYHHRKAWEFRVRQFLKSV